MLYGLAIICRSRLHDSNTAKESFEPRPPELLTRDVLQATVANSQLKQLSTSNS